MPVAWSRSTAMPSSLKVPAASAPLRRASRPSWNDSSPEVGQPATDRASAITSSTIPIRSPSRSSVSDGVGQPAALVIERRGQPGEAAHVGQQDLRVRVRDQVVRVGQPQEHLRRRLPAEATLPHRGHRLERVAEATDERCGLRRQRARQGLDGEARIGPDRVRAHQAVEVGHQAPKGGVEPPGRGPLRLDHRLEAGVEQLLLVGGEGLEERVLGREPLVERRSGHARGGRDRRHRELPGTPLGDHPARGGQDRLHARGAPGRRVPHGPDHYTVAGNCKARAPLQKVRRVSRSTDRSTGANCEHRLRHRWHRPHRRQRLSSS